MVARRILLLLAILWNLAGCASKTEPVWQAQAPSAANDLGWLVQVSDSQSLRAQSQLEQGLKGAGSHGRILSAHHGLFEVTGLSENQIHELLPDAIIERNQMFHKQAQNISLSLASQFAQATSSNVESCVSFETDLPTADILAQGEAAADLLGRKVLVRENQQLVQLSAKSSSAKIPGPLTYSWIISTPKSSHLPKVISTGEKFEFTPDAIGLYGIILRVQDSRGACGYAQLQFVFTARPAYNLNPRKSDPPDLRTFTHLSQVKAPDVWQSSQGDGVLIAIVDSGVNYNHPDLAPNIHVNQKEIANNAIDDDQNGFVDDVIGWNFSYGDNSPYDDDGHGSHVAGLAASAVSGVAPHAQILPIKALNGFGNSDLGTMVAAIYYAVDQGAQIINTSFGTYGTDEGGIAVLSKAIAYAQARNVILVAAAGNGNNVVGFNTEYVPFYPGSLKLANIVTVAALDSDNKLTDYSNYSAKLVSVAAPGGTQMQPLKSTTLETLDETLYALDNGTSMAAPIASGIIALGLAQSPHVSYDQLIHQLLLSGEPLPALRDKIASGRALNANSFLQGLKIPPSLAANSQTIGDPSLSRGVDAFSK